MRNLCWLLSLALLLLPLPSLAWPNPNKPQALPAPQVPTLIPDSPELFHQWRGFTFSAYVEPSDNYLSRSNHFISAIHDRLFDIEPNGFTLQQLAFTLARQPTQGLGGLLNVIAGRDASTLTSVGMNPNYFGIQNFGVDFTQVYLQYAYGGFTLLAGKFNGLSGIEDNSPIQNANFSHSLINQFAEPGTVLGLRGLYVFNPHWSCSLGVNNGWDIINDWGRQKTLELGLLYQPLPAFSIAAQAYSGEQPAVEFTTIGPIGKRRAIDVFATYELNDKISFAFDYDYVTQSRATLPQGPTLYATWTGFTGYLTYYFKEKWYTTLRGEIFSDPQGYQTGVPECIKEATLTLYYAPFRQLSFRVEARHDISNAVSFLNKSGVGANRNLQSFALEGIYRF